MAYKFYNVAYKQDTITAEMTRNGANFIIGYEGVASIFDFNDFITLDEIFATGFKPFTPGIDKIDYNNTNYSTKRIILIDNDNVEVSFSFYTMAHSNGNYYISAQIFQEYKNGLNAHQVNGFTPWFDSYDTSTGGAMIKFTDQWSAHAKFYITSLSNNSNLYLVNHLNSTNAYVTVLGSNYDTQVLIRNMEQLTDNLPPAEPEPVIVPVDTDPYGKGGNSSTGGGGGKFTETSEPVPFPPAPTITALDSGFIRLFTPTLTQLKNLASYMWSDAFDVATFQKIFADPMDCILGLSIVPVTVPNGGAHMVTVGNMPTNVMVNTATTQYVTVDCGSVAIDEFWGSYLDYSPFTKIELYLPYVGTHPIDVDECMGKTVAVQYCVDILTGACIAHVKCGDSVLYSFSGQCSAQIPMTSTNWIGAFQGALSVAASIGTMIGSGGLTAPTAMGTVASVAGSVASTKPSVEKSGAIAGSAGMMGIQKPYLTITRPEQAVPEKQNTFKGYPSMITAKLSDLQGYTVVDEIHLENMSCFKYECEMIENMLKGGVII